MKNKSITFVVSFFCSVLFLTVTANSENTKCPVVEVGIGKLKSTTNEKDFLKDSKALDKSIAKMKGFVSRRFYKIKDTNQWMDIVCWQSEEDAKKAADEVHKVPACNAYLSHYNEKPELFIHGVAY